MGYRSAARGFQLGMGIGQRAKEFDELQGLRESEERRRKQRFKWDKDEQEAKLKFKVVKREVDTAKAMIDAGDERGAAKKIADLYNEKYPNGDEVRIIFKSDNPQDPKWESDPNLKGKDMAILSKTGGILPYKNMKELMNFVATSMDYGQFKKDSDAATAKVADANRESKPFRSQDGNMYIQQFKEGPGGSIVKAGDPVPYTGKTAIKGGLGEAAESGLDVSKLTKDDKKILAGIREKEKQPKQWKPGEVEKLGAERVQAELKSYKAQLSLLAKPFTKEAGTMMVDPDTMEITKAGQSAWDKARQLFSKYEKKENLTDDERKKLAEAKSFIDKFEEVRQFISDLPKYKRKKKNSKKGGKPWDKRSKKQSKSRGMKLQSSREWNINK